MVQMVKNGKIWTKSFKLAKNGQQRSKTEKTVKRKEKNSKNVQQQWTTVNTVKNCQKLSKTEKGPQWSKTGNKGQKRSIRLKTVKNGNYGEKHYNKKWSKKS